MGRYFTKYIFFLILCASLSTSYAFASTSVGVNESPPFVMKSSNGELQGLSYELWSLISKKLSLQSDYKTFGLQEGLEQLEEKNIDVLVGAYSLTVEREKRFDFTHAFYSSGFGLAVLGEESHFLLAIAKSLFSVDFFMAVAALVFILLAGGALIWILERKVNPEQFSPDHKQRLWDGFWWSAVTMTTVGYGDKAQLSKGGKAFSLVLMFASIILISGLTGSIAASLAVKRLSTQVGGLEDLRNRPLAVLEKSSAKEYLSKNGFKNLKPFVNMDEALTALELNEVKGFVHDKPLLVYQLSELSEKHQNIVVLPQIYGDDKYAFVLPQYSDLRKKINKAMIEILKSAEWEKIKKSYDL